jgi:hypothetical protein
MAKRAHYYGDYQTPTWVVELLLNEIPLIGTEILEPCAGSGTIVEVIKQRRPRARVAAVELRGEEENSLWIAGADEVHIADFRTWKPPAVQYDTIITNPPYRYAQEIIERCFEIADSGTQVIMLLRLAFLESQKRFSFWQKHPISRLYVLSERPSFTGGGTDATAYAWFVWSKSITQRVKVLSRREWVG